MSEEQTLVMYSGHPMGLFPSSAAGPRMIITNGMVIPNYSSREDYDNMFALGVSMYVRFTESRPRHRFLENMSTYVPM
jgi:urocanate hydratase